MMKQKDMLFLLLEKAQYITITVRGISMEPTLHKGDSITIEKCADYQVGDIIVFRYKHNELLVHRIVKRDNRLYCKGDNAFRLEDITNDQIAGKIVRINNQPPKNWPVWLTDLSLKVGLEFRKQHYNIEATKQTYIYKHYLEVISTFSTKTTPLPTSLIEV